MINSIEMENKICVSHKFRLCGHIKLSCAFCKRARAIVRKVRKSEGAWCTHHLSRWLHTRIQHNKCVDTQREKKILLFSCFFSFFCILPDILQRSVDASTVQIKSVSPSTFQPYILYELVINRFAITFYKWCWRKCQDEIDKPFNAKQKKLPDIGPTYDNNSICNEKNV